MKYALLNKEGKKRIRLIQSENHEKIMLEKGIKIVEMELEDRPLGDYTHDGEKIYIDERNEEKRKARIEAERLMEWFDWYDKQVCQYNRSLRCGQSFNRDMRQLDFEAIKNAEKIKEIRRREEE